MTLNITDLENFILTAEHGSLSRAATVAGLVQPALGRQIQKLESECGCRLFYRNGRGVTLTEEGERYLERIRPLVTQLRAASQDLHQSAAEVTGKVVVGMTPTVVEMLGYRLLVSVRKKYPQVAINIVSGYSGYIHEWLIDGRLDVAFLHDAKRSRHSSFEPLAEASLFLVSAPETLSKRERTLQSVNIKQLSSYNMVLPTRAHGLRRTLEFAAGQAGFDLNIEYEVDTLQLMKKLVINRMAHTVLALPVVLAEVNSSQLVARKIMPTVSTTLGLATATNRPSTKAIQAVLQLIRQEMISVVDESSTDLFVHVL